MRFALALVFCLACATANASVNPEISDPPRAAAAEKAKDTATLQAIEQIFAKHEDNNIEPSLVALNALQVDVSDHSPVELQEALHRVYGNLYFDVGNFSLALEHQLKALELSSKLKENPGLARLNRLSTIAELYLAMNLPDPALRYVSLAKAQPEYATDMRSRSYLSTIEGNAFTSTGDYASAEKALQFANASLSADSNRFERMHLLTAEASMFLAAGRISEARKSIDELERRASEGSNAYYRTKAQLLSGQWQVMHAETHEGIQRMHAATDAFRAMGQQVDVLDGLRRQVAAFKQTESWPLAVDAMTAQQALQAQLFSSEGTRRIAELEAGRKSQEQAMLIKSLESRNALKAARIRAQALTAALLATLAVLLGCLAFLLYLARQRARRERDALNVVARVDALTGARSRYELDHLPASRTQQHEPSSRVALLLFDLDHFKTINDTHGHAAGDAMLRAVVEAVRTGLHIGDDIYRMGGRGIPVDVCAAQPGCIGL